MLSKLLRIIFGLLLILPTHAQGNVSVEEIGTEPTVLIDGINAHFYAKLNNSLYTQTEVTLQFLLDSKNVSVIKNVIIEPRKSKKITSEGGTSISSGNREISVIVYENSLEVAKKSVEISVSKQQPIREEGTNYTVFWVLAVLGGIIILIFIIYSNIKNRSFGNENGFKYGNRNLGSLERVSDPGSKIQYPGTSLKENIAKKEEMSISSNDEIAKTSVLHLNDPHPKKNAIIGYLRSTSEELRKEKEYEFISDFLENIASTMRDEGSNDNESGDLDLIKKGTKALISNIKAKEPRIADKIHITLELEKMKNEVDSKRQFFDIYIPYFLLLLAEKKLNDNKTEVAEGLIYAAKDLLYKEEVIDRLRKLREIGL